MVCQVLITKNSSWLPGEITLIQLFSLWFFFLSNFGHVPEFWKMKLSNMAEKYFIRALWLLACLQHVKFLTAISIDSSMFNNVFIPVVFPEQLGLLSFGATTAKARKWIFQPPPHPPPSFFFFFWHVRKLWFFFFILLMKCHGNHWNNEGRTGAEVEDREEMAHFIALCMVKGLASGISFSFQSQANQNSYRAVFPAGFCLNECFCFRQIFWSGKGWVFCIKTNGGSSNNRVSIEMLLTRNRM